MKNVINENPDFDLNGRFKKSIEFVDKRDISGKKILDVGCGYGWFAVHALRSGAEQFTGIEVSAKDLITIRKHVKDKRLRTSVGSAIKIPYPSNSFDTVVAWEVIEHIPAHTENQMFAEVGRVLKKGGVFYLSTPNKDPRSTYTDPAYWLVDHRHYSVQSLVLYGVSKKLSTENVLVAGGYWTVISLLYMYASKWILRGNGPLKNYLIAKDNKDYGNRNGFYNVFIKFIKR